MQKTILILESVSTKSTKEAIEEFQKVLKYKNVRLRVEDNSIHFSIITDIHNVLKRPDGPTFTGLAACCYEEMLHKTMSRIAEYIYEHYPECLYNENVSKWLLMINEDPIAAQKFFIENHLENIVHFRWSTEASEA